MELTQQYDELISPPPSKRKVYCMNCAYWSRNCDKDYNAAHDSNSCKIPNPGFRNYGVYTDEDVKYFTATGQMGFIKRYNPELRQAQLEFVRQRYRDAHRDPDDSWNAYIRTMPSVLNYDNACICYKPTGGYIALKVFMFPIWGPYKLFRGIFRWFRR